MAANFVFLGVSEKDICLNAPKDVSFSSLLDGLKRKGVVTSSYHYTHNGSPIEDTSNHLDISPSEDDSHLIIIRGYARLLGGKGGFGALIRAMGMRMNRNRNKDACRDLTGRRLRTINTEKKLTELLKKEPEKRKREVEEKVKKRRRLLEGPYHKFNDKKYVNQLEASHDSLEVAVQQGLANGGKKRKGDGEGPSSSKRGKLWMDPDDLDITDDSEEESGSVEESSSLLTTPPTVTNGNDLGIPILPPPTQQIDQQNTYQEDSDPLPDQSHQSDHTHQLDCAYESDHAHQSDNIANTIEPDCSSKDQLIPPFSYEQFDLNDFASIEELEAIGGVNLKLVLQKRGLKCGGTPHERAVRLWCVRGKGEGDIDPSLLATAGKTRSRNKRKK